MTTRLTTTLALILGLAAPAVAQDSILNVSYDVARELFADINPAFAEKWQADTGRTVSIDQSHGGSSRQARAILEGLPADVVTFNQVTDIDVLANNGLVAENWRDAFPNEASPYYSLPAFLVREGNPKNITDWDDLTADGVQVIFPNPKTSGNARYTYLAAYAFALNQNGGDQAGAQEFVAKLFANVPVFDTGGRAATTTFAERGLGDVLITFEAETGGIAAEYADANFERVTPSLSLLAEFPVAVVNANTDKKGSTEVSTAYLDFLYSTQGQQILANHYYRVNDPAVETDAADVELVTVDDVFGGWAQVQSEHFAEGGILDKVFVNQ
ncbi:sulfate ABC transporter substrate-binding protein [Paracoccus sp. (in: a-proteobacteria)]|uniref:sulfate ABC transporter substrate-binding protein n=1 Tax=Paracoccus sp. TaxID=267 RepID=UPI0026DFD6CC|nr:sulfate ABC transporter substrate-binding protein [Paracoccus sp. (in: a-proteobacteria)]MDO5647233.1 sulfate ABC transporter substrate-binding protein [Paracoccus sp. (in: a-proteobacteria)]